MCKLFHKHATRWFYPQPRFFGWTRVRHLVHQSKRRPATIYVSTQRQERSKVTPPYPDCISSTWFCACGLLLRVVLVCLEEVAGFSAWICGEMLSEFTTHAYSRILQRAHLSERLLDLFHDFFVVRLQARQPAALRVYYA